MSAIEWTQKTWNPLAGCKEESAGCENCYARSMAWRLMHMPNPDVAKKYAGTVQKTAGGKLQWTGKINFDLEAITIPERTKAPTTFFVNSMSDLFHPSVPFYFIGLVFTQMKDCEQHTFQILTKHPDRMLEFFESGIWINSKGYTPLPNVWLGVSVEDQHVADKRIPALLQTPAAVRFLSCEPLIGALNLEGYIPYPDSTAPLGITEEDIEIWPIDWVIAGGESGHNARPVHPDWIRSLRDQCKDAGVPFFFKQWGEWLPLEESAQAPFRFFSNTGKLIDGHHIDVIDPVTGEAGTYKSHKFMDAMDAIVFCDENDSAICNFLKTGKHYSGRLLDGVEHNEYPKIIKPK